MTADNKMFSQMILASSITGQEIIPFALNGDNYYLTPTMLVSYVATSGVSGDANNTLTKGSDNKLYVAGWPGISTDAGNTLHLGTDRALLDYAFKGDPTNGLSLDYAQGVEVTSPNVVLSDGAANLKINSGVVWVTSGACQMYVASDGVVLSSPAENAGNYSTVDVASSAISLNIESNNLILTPNILKLSANAPGSANFTLTLSGASSYVPSSDAGTLTNFKSWLGIGSGSAYPGISTDAGNTLHLGSDNKLLVSTPSLQAVTDVSSKTTDTIQVVDDPASPTNTAALGNNFLTIGGQTAHMAIYEGHIQFDSASRNFNIDLTTSPPVVQSDAATKAAWLSYLGVSGSSPVITVNSPNLSVTGLPPTTLCRIYNMTNWTYTTWNTDTNGTLNWTNSGAAGPFFIEYSSGSGFVSVGVAALYS